MSARTLNSRFLYTAAFFLAGMFLTWPPKATHGATSDG